jgi:hypothetical protein
MMVAYHGIERDHKEWAAFLGITEQTMRWRIKHWGVAKALRTPRGTVIRSKSRTQYLTLDDKARAIRAYVGGRSEDDIAADIGVSRRWLSGKFIEWGIKRKGKRPQRVAGASTKVRTTDRTIHLTIAA